MSRRFSFGAFLLVFLLSISCKKNHETPPINENVDLDGTKINDSSLSYPSHFLLSAAIPNPTVSDLAKPVVIAVHGYSATTFEWIEFRDFARNKGDFYVSVVLLGGHGRDYADFKAANWENWQKPIIEEYNKLRDIGYQNINFVASSTGCPLVLDAIRENKFTPDRIKHVYFIDPIIIPSNKILSLAPVVGPFVGYLKTELDAGENGFWYKYRPQHSLKQLEKLTRQERKKLEKGVVLPAGVRLKVYKAHRDGSADPASAVQLQKGLKESNGNEIVVRVVDSDLHVFTRLKGRNVVSDADRKLQAQVFEEIHSEL